MQNLDLLEKAARENDVQIVRALNNQLAGLDAERNKKIAEIRAEYGERPKTLKTKRTEWIRRVKKLLSKDEYEELVNRSETGARSDPEPLPVTGVDHESAA